MAVESLLKTLIGDPNADLERALQSLNGKILLHPALKLSLTKLYAYASAAGGRHGAIENDDGKWSDEQVAKFVLSNSSAWIRLITEKARSAGIAPFS